MQQHPTPHMYQAGTVISHMYQDGTVISHMYQAGTVISHVSEHQDTEIRIADEDCKVVCMYVNKF